MIKYYNSTNSVISFHILKNQAYQQQIDNVSRIIEIKILPLPTVCVKNYPHTLYIENYMAEETTS